jgi:four helix bundle protein
MRDFRKLAVWERAYKLTLSVYRATAGFPDTEQYGLVSQSRRAATSIAANIAEGCGRGGQADFRRFLQIAMGSASELEFHLLLAQDLGMLSTATYKPLAAETVAVKRMLASLIVKMRAESPEGRTLGLGPSHLADS